MKFSPFILIKGAGEMASATAWRLHAAGFRRICMLELDKPLAVRRWVSFSPAIESGTARVEGITAVRVADWVGVQDSWKVGEIAVMPVSAWRGPRPDIVVDARLAKRKLDTRMDDADCVIALGPGFTAGEDCHFLIETNRGHDLARIITRGAAAANTGVPGVIAGFGVERVLRAPVAGTFSSHREIGQTVAKGEPVGTVADRPVVAEIDGMLRGLIQPGTAVKAGFKLGDIDPRGEPRYCATISDKARAISGSALEAVLRVWNR